MNAAQSCEPAPQASPDRQSRALPATSRVLLLVLTLALWTLLYRNLIPATEWLVYDLIGLAHETHLGETIWFFVYEVPKVLMLLALIVFGVGIVRTFFTPERTRAALQGKRESVGNVLAGVLGIVTPFCSCSAVPLFIGFVESGIPLGVTFSFLIAAPLVNEVALVLLFGLVGWQVALIYLGTGLTLAIVGGWIIGRLHMESHVEDWVYEMQLGEAAADGPMDVSQRIDEGLVALRDIVGRVWVYVIIGIAVGAGIHGYVPEETMAAIMGRGAWWAVPVAALMGVPMYSNAAGVIPVVEALLGKGAALGTTLAFMMSVIALSLPEGVILRKVLKPRLLATFFGIVAGGIIIVGFIFNALM